jgi:hypothetical protein
MNNVKISVRVTAEMQAALRQLSHQSGVSQQALHRAALGKFLQQPSMPAVNMEATYKQIGGEIEVEVGVKEGAEEGSNVGQNGGETHVINTLEGWQDEVE